MIHILIALTLAAQAGGSKRPEPKPSASPTPVVSATPSPSPWKPLVVFGAGVGPNVNREYAAKAIALLNGAYSSGCIERKMYSHPFTSLNSVFTPTATSPIAAYRTYVAGAPYPLDLRWYSKSFTSTIGYTYNFADDDWGGESETRIWTNTRKLGDERMYAAHLAHELSHQARAGGYVHYTTHQGSFPYEIGDVVSECLQERL